MLFENIDKVFKKNYIKNINERYPCIRAYIESYIKSLEEQYDTDVSEDAMKYYKEKWGFLNNGEIQNKRDNCNKYNHKKQILLSAQEGEYLVFGDTLNSMKHIFTYFLKEFTIKIGYEKTEWNNKDYNQKMLSLIDIVFSNTNLKKVEWSRPILMQFEIFAQLSGTRGNFFPCLPLFNAERSNYGQYDFSDLLLCAIYTYLNDTSNDSPLDQLFNGISDIKDWDKYDHISQSKKRLKYYLDNYYNNSWGEFISKNYFQDLVDEKLKPKMLWNNHTFENCKYPSLGEELYDLLCTINRNLILRNCRIETL